jgi:L-methionine (R)-S-oxide reductase
MIFGFANAWALLGWVILALAPKREIVVPIVIGGKLVGVLDIDSPSLERFDGRDQDGLETIVRVLAKKLAK